jgi:hypothetical protein
MYQQLESHTNTFFQSRHFYHLTLKLKPSPPPLAFKPLVSNNKIAGPIQQPAIPKQDKYKNAMALTKYKVTGRIMTCNTPPVQSCRGKNVKYCIFSEALTISPKTKISTVQCWLFQLLSTDTKDSQLKEYCLHMPSEHENNLVYHNNYVLQRFNCKTSERMTYRRISYPSSGKAVQDLFHSQTSQHTTTDMK